MTKGKGKRNHHATSFCDLAINYHNTMLRNALIDDAMYLNAAVTQFGPASQSLWYLYTQIKPKPQTSPPHWQTSDSPSVSPLCNQYADASFSTAIPLPTMAIFFSLFFS